MGPDGIHPEVMEQLEELTKLPSVIYHPKEVPDDRTVAKVMHINKRGWKEDPGIAGLLA